MRTLLIFPIVLLYTITIFTAACKSPQPPASTTPTEASTPKDTILNPPAPGFDAKGSDKKAIELADKVMASMGGRKAWDNARYFTWNFFGSRKHYWDKHTGDIRIDYLKEDKTVLLNVNTKKGNVMRNGVIETNVDTIKRYLFEAYGHWINDSYWLFMPFKLKDTGVTLKHKGFGTAASGFPAEILELTFKKTGLTPQNKYLVYVNVEHFLVSQWAFFKNADQAEADFVMPWKGYRQYGPLALSADRGERQLTEIGVFNTIPDHVLTTFEPVE